MKLKSLLLGYWTKPNLNSDEIVKEKKKENLSLLFDRCESRLESLEILTSNDKIEDAKLILKALVFDLVNLHQTIFDKPEYKETPDLESFVKTIEIPKKREKDFLVFSELSSVSEWTGETFEKNLEKIYTVFSYFQNIYSQRKKEILFTEYDAFKRAYFLKATTVISVLVLLVGSYLSYSYKYPVLKAQNFKIYFLESKENQNRSEENSVQIQLPIESKGEWVNFEWELPAQMTEFGALRFEPLTQRGIRFSITDFQVLDTKGKVLLERKFDLGPDYLPKGYSDFISFEDVKTVSNLKPGDILEMDSTGSRPQFTLSNHKVLLPKKVKLRARFLETYIAKKK